MHRGVPSIPATGTAVRLLGWGLEPVVESLCLPTLGSGSGLMALGPLGTLTAPLPPFLPFPSPGLSKQHLPRAR